MFKYVIFTILIFFNFSQIVYCQEGFNKAIYFENSKGLNFDDLYLEDDGIVVAGNVYVDSLGLWGLCVAKFDTLGTLLWQASITDTQGFSHILQNTPSRFTKIKDGGYVVPIKMFDRDNIALVKISSMGELEFIKEYTNFSFYMIANSIIEADEGFYISGWENRLEQGTFCFLMKTDARGNFMWIKYYGDQGFQQLPGTLVLHSDSVISLGCIIYPSNIDEIGFEAQWSRPWIISVNLKGELISEWKGLPNDFKAKSAAELILTNNGEWGIIYSVFKKVTIGFSERIYSAPVISILDSSFNLIWKDTFGLFTSPLNTFYDLAYDAMRNEWLVVGQIGIGNGIGGVVVKYSMDGEVLWHKENYIFNDTSILARHWIAGVAISGSGSIYTAGHVEYVNPPYFDYGWILKLTSDGCVDTLCSTTSISNQIDIPEKYALHPNPAIDFITIKSNTGFSSIKVLDMSGKVRKTEDYSSDGLDHSIDISNLNSGMYIMQILDDKKQISKVKFIVTD